ncbi:HupE/UreJ family protein [Pseudonocardia halophobica]|uniref:HupE/UreJ family protein n=1 Tax=Pseudonocardia halophobica TaxID=29401 RepID=UPI003D8EE1A1
MREVRRWSTLGAAGAFLVMPLLMVLMATPVAAHGLDQPAERSLPQFLGLGMLHMLGGWDHLLFIAGVILLAREAGRAAKLISLFAAGHSLTLLLSVGFGWRMDVVFVDVVIALSVVFIGVAGLLPPPIWWPLVTGAVFVFGLVHGVGLATRFAELRLPQEGLLGWAVAFNIGIELGQVMAISVLAFLAECVRRRLESPRFRRGLHLGLVAAGCLAAAALLLPSDASVPDEAAASTAVTSRFG